jgi:hypothetical protein
VTTTEAKRVAVVQAAPVVFDCAATLAKVQKLATDAAAGGAGLVLFPEGFISGYPRGISFGTVIGNRTPEGRDHFRRYWESSIDVPGPVLDQLVVLAAELVLQWRELVHAGEDHDGSAEARQPEVDWSAVGEQCRPWRSFPATWWSGRTTIREAE